MDKKKFLLFIEAGHTMKTPGKQSPDYKTHGPLSLKETLYCRNIVEKIKEKCKELNIDVIDVTPDLNVEDSLAGRVKKVNTQWDQCKRKGKEKALYLSIHNNAAGNGLWLNATGWCVFTTKGVTKSDAAAETFWKEAEKVLVPLGKKLRKDMSDGDHDEEANFYVIKYSNIPSILTENFFQDNKEDVAWLLSDEGKKAIVDLHVNGIKKYIESL